MQNNTKQKLPIKIHLTELLLLLITTTLAFFYYIQSINAHGFVVPVSAMLVFLYFPLIFVLGTYNVLVGWLTKSSKKKRLSLICFLCCSILVLGVFFGGNRAQSFHLETEQRGNEILKSIKQYKLSNGKCPVSQSDLGKPFLKPALKKTDFKMIKVQGKCGVEFYTTGWLTCTKTLNQKNGNVEIERD